MANIQQSGSQAGAGTSLLSQQQRETCEKIAALDEGTGQPAGSHTTGN